MSLTQTVTQKLNPATRCVQMGIPYTRSGPITLDSYITDLDGNRENFKCIFVTTGGLVVIEDFDGNVGLAVIPDQGIRYCPGKRVLTSGVIGVTTYTTTATGIYWGGGA